MDTRILNAVGFIGQYFAEYEEEVFEQEDLNDALLDHGFSGGEITEAFRWIEEKTLAGGLAKKAFTSTQISPSLRVLNRVETMVITPAAHGVLIELHTRGVIDLIIVEEIIERAMELGGGDVNAKSMRRLAALTVFSHMQSDWREWLQSNTTVLQ